MKTKTIYKSVIPFRIGIPQTLSMKSDARIIRFAVQDGNPCIWYTCDRFAELTDRTFIIHGTGHDIMDSFEYIGTADEGPFVWHLFEVV